MPTIKQLKKQLIKKNPKLPSILKKDKAYQKELKKLKEGLKTKKIESKHLGMRCNVPYIYPLTITNIIADKGLVEISYSNGQYDRVRFFVHENDIVIDPKDLTL